MALHGQDRIQIILQVHLSDTIINKIIEDEYSWETICGMTAITMIRHLENSYVPAHKRQTVTNSFTLS